MKQIKVETLYTELPDGSWLTEARATIDAKTVASPATITEAKALAALLAPILEGALTQEKANLEEAKALGATAVEEDRARTLKDVESVALVVETLQDVETPKDAESLSLPVEKL